MARLTDEDGIDGPWERAVSAPASRPRGKRKTFIEGEPVEIVPDANGLGVSEADWKPAIYIKAGGHRRQPWHHVKFGLETRLVPVRRIRKRGAASRAPCSFLSARCVLGECEHVAGLDLVQAVRS